jgi:phosphoribosyl 1,2-cyclic phosphodiesterase
VQGGRFGALLDLGLGPRQLATRLGVAGGAWADIHAVLLTHTHSDHWNDLSFAHLHRRQVPLYCHPAHHAALETWSGWFPRLKASGLVHDYHSGEPFALAPGLTCQPIPVRHDGGETFGFRIEGLRDLFGGACAAGYVADLGSWDGELAGAVADVDLLAVEFNHDVGMECASGRSPHLIARVLGDEGHLSNEQGAALVREVLRRSTPGRLRHLVLLHLSRHCNHPELARAAACKVIEGLSPPVTLHTGSQDRVLATIELGSAATTTRPRRRAGRRRNGESPPTAWLPGMEDG